MDESASYQPLALKYRPRFWSDLVGQEVMVQTITNMLKEGRLIPSLIFGGSRGIGKTTSARILAKALNCTDRNGESLEPCGKCASCVGIDEERTFSVQEMDAASHGLVDDVRRIRDELQYADTSSHYRVYIIDEAHSLSKNAWQAFLKLLEEPPPRTVFVFCTTETSSIPDTIISRSANFAFSRLSVEKLVGRLDYIAKAERFDCDPSVYASVARHVNGGMRDAISLLDQLKSYAGSSPISMDHVAYVLGTVNVEGMYKLYQALVSGDLRKAYTLLQGIYTEISDISSFVADLANFYRDLLLAQVGVAIPDVQPDHLYRLQQAVKGVNTEYLLESQNELARLSDQLRRSRLPARTVVDIHIAKLVYGGIRITPVKDKQPEVTVQPVQPMDSVSYKDLAETLDGVLTQI